MAIRMTEKTELKNAGGWVRSLLAGLFAGGLTSVVGFIAFGYQIGAYTTKTEIGLTAVQTQVKEIAEQTKVQVNVIAEDTKKQIENTEIRLTDKIKAGADNLSTVANANQQAVNALATLSNATAISSTQNIAQDREIDDIKRSLRDLNTTLRDINSALRFQVPAQPARPAPSE